MILHNRYLLLYMLAFFFIQADLIAQDPQLANQYYNSGEYEKAADMYKKLFEDNGRNDYYFERYLNALMAMRDYKTTEKELKRELRRRPEAVHLNVTYGVLLELEFEPEKAEEQYQIAIKNLPKDRNSISRLGNAFVSRAKYDYAIETYEQGSSLLKSDNIFAYNLGDLYRRQGDNEKMIRYYLLSLLEIPGRLPSLQTTFQRYLIEEDYEELIVQLYDLIQEYPDEISFPEMLEWVFIQTKQYDKALRQAKALNARLDENGLRIYNIGQVALNESDFETAESAFEHIVSNYGINSPYYFEAKKDLLIAKRRNLLERTEYTEADLRNIEKEYEAFIGEMGMNNQTALLIQQLADFEALYLNDSKKAIRLLEELVDMRGINKYIQANCKLDLGDYYLINGEIWDATLLYSQVEKAFKEEYLGEQARYKNALLAYYAGDFEWSQAQFDILKSATSKLISNDAIDRSVFIMDNLGLDTTDVPLKMFSEAELLLYQNKVDEAFVKLDSISEMFPDHGLTDDILYIKAKLYRKKREYDKAIEMYTEVMTNHKEDVKCDNSIFELAELYEQVLDQPDKAMELYQTLFLDYSNSTLAVEARKRFRRLRGDEIQ